MSITLLDFVKIVCLLLAVVALYYMNRSASNFSRRLSQRFAPTKQTFTVALVGDVVGHEKNALNILFGAYDLFKKVGGRTDNFRFLIKTPSHAGFDKVLQNLAAACPISVIGLVCTPPEEQHQPPPVVSSTIAVPDWNKDGDETPTLFEHSDYLFFLATKPDQTAQAQYDAFQKPKMMYDLTRPDYHKPVASSNI